MRRRFKKRYGLLVVLLFLALAINAPGLTALFYQLSYTPKVAALPQAPAFSATDRVLLLSPHPDDETLCCAGMLQQAVAAGAAVYIAWLTSGDGFEWDAVLLRRTPDPGDTAMLELGRQRMNEARTAARVLGIPQAHLRFLGYPDQGLLRLFLDYYYYPFTAPHTGVDRVPYPGTLSPGAPYTGENLERDLERLFDAIQPTVVLAPSPLDAHPDHRATGDLALRLLGKRKELGKARFWIVHGGLEWPLPKGLHKNLPLEPPPRGRGLPWQRVDLSPKQVEVKLEAARAHHSQMLILGRFMEAFVRQNELISPLPLPEPSAHPVR
ncbi:PIG-L deacetylase family protein [Calidithermus timidus]|uniref:PIG-L deacetylase family protein n=1 Tax=Calidithermus timidus TaxID=307124 RepID=UPI00035DA77A|nr:PIG-L domain-containing protein [Calidithermus timidus]